MEVVPRNHGCRCLQAPRLEVHEPACMQELLGQHKTFYALKQSMDFQPMPTSANQWIAKSVKVIDLPTCTPKGGENTENDSSSTFNIEIQI